MRILSILSLGLVFSFTLLTQPTVHADESLSYEALYYGFDCVKTSASAGYTSSDLSDSCITGAKIALEAKNFKSVQALKTAEISCDKENQIRVASVRFTIKFLEQESRIERLSHEQQRELDKAYNLLYHGGIKKINARICKQSVQNVFAKQSAPKPAPKKLSQPKRDIEQIRKECLQIRFGTITQCL